MQTSWAALALQSAVRLRLEAYTPDALTITTVPAPPNPPTPASAVTPDATVAVGAVIGESFVKILSASPAMGKAEALRQLMLAMIDSDDQTFRHPSSWAAFSLVGD